MASLEELYQQYLGRAPDPSGISTWSGQDEASIIAGILGSQEYANRGGDSGGGGGGGGSSAPVLDSSNPTAAVEQIYQKVLGRAPDAGAQGWVDAIANGADPQAIAQQIANSQEGRNYAAQNPQAQYAGLAELSQETNPLAGTNTPYSNMQYVGPSFESLASDERGYRFKDASGGIVTTNSAGQPIFYSPGESWYQEQYAKNPDAVRTGYAGQQYLAAGPLEQTYNFNGQNIPIVATEYQINPQTRQLTQNPVVYEPSNDFTSWATSPMGALTLGAGLLGGAYGLTSLFGAGAAGAAGAGATGAGAGGLDAYMTAAGLNPGTFSGSAFTLPSFASVGNLTAGADSVLNAPNVSVNLAPQTGGTFGSLTPPLTGSGAVPGAMSTAIPGTGLTGALPAGVLVGDGTLGTTMGATYMAAGPGQFAVDAFGNAIPATSVGFEGFAPATGFENLLSSLGNVLKTPLGQLGVRGGLGLLAGGGAGQQAVPQMQAGGGTYVPRGQVDYTPILNLLAPRQIARSTNSLLG